MAPTPPPYDLYGGYPVPPVPMPTPAPVPAPSSYVPVQVIPMCHMPFSPVVKILYQFLLAIYLLLNNGNGEFLPFA